MTKLGKLKAILEYWADVDTKASIRHHKGKNYMTAWHYSNTSNTYNRILSLIDNDYALDKFYKEALEYNKEKK